MDSKLNAPTWGPGVLHLRRRRGLSQADLARLVGCTQATISRLETNRTRQLSDAQRVTIADALGADPHELFPYRADGGRR